MSKAVRLKRVSRKQSIRRAITGQERTGSEFIVTGPIATAEGMPFVYPFELI